MAFGEKLGVKPTRITVRDTSSRWGSCSSARSLSFSWRLIFAIWIDAMHALVEVAVAAADLRFVIEPNGICYAD